MLVYPPGIDYIAAFFGCLYAGAIAVPAYPPDQARLGNPQCSLAAIARNAGPSGVLTSAAAGAALPALTGAVPGLRRLRMIVTDHLTGDQAWQPAVAVPESVALLQYTSGSTSAPKGVALTHRNLISNSETIFRSFGHSRESRGVVWLPPYPDMGLIGGIVQPLYGGVPVTLMAPADFLREPVRWLQEISRTRATISGGPNFAYDLCVRKTSAEDRSRLDLSSWQVAFNGSEPVRAETMEEFARVFEPSGFRAEAFYPCYGLAESTLLVTGGIPWLPDKDRSFDVAALQHGRAIPGVADAASRRVVSCGSPSAGHRVLIVDPGTCEERAAGEIGEIWISGDSAAQSYWHRPRETRASLGARLADTGEGPFVRSGDLGFLLDDQLYVMGRIKDLIVIRGRNYHPQDIELTAERSSPVLRRGRGAAFTVADDGRERLVVAYETIRTADSVDVGAASAMIRAAVAAEHGLQVHTVVLLKSGGIPKTSSGKVRRRLCAALFEQGKLTELGRSTLGQAPVSGRPRLDPRGLRAVPTGRRRALLEEYLGRLIAAICEIDEAEMTDAPLLALGVDSAAMIRIQHSIQTDLEVHLTASDLAQAMSIGDLAVRLDERLGIVAPPLQPGSRSEHLPWFPHGSGPGSTEHSAAVALGVRGELDISALEYAVEALVARLAPEGMDPDGQAAAPAGLASVQKIAGTERMEWLRESDAAEADDTQLAECLERAAREPFDLVSGPLLRIHLYRRSGQETVLLIVTHHVVADVWSLTSIVRELERLYAEQAEGVYAPLPELTDFVRHYSWISGSRVSVHAALNPETAASPRHPGRSDGQQRLMHTASGEARYADNRLPG